MTPVVSPTFGIMKVYELENHPHFDQLVHIDAYRIEDISEVGPLRFAELFKSPRMLICLEWPEKIIEILPVEKVEVTIEIGEGEQRIVSVI
jgi:tRNA threonylcarbamoyl adenosine modification protein YjeE